jgi:hypothetical protein
VKCDRSALLEISVLRALCGCGDLRRLRDAVERVRTHEWGNADHSVVFGAIRECVERGAVVTREAVIGMATRAGFPDVELAEYFAGGDGLSLEEAVEKLLAAR